jgi:streptomycin 6-kinase
VRRRRPGDGDARRAPALSENLPDLVALQRVAHQVAAEWGLELGETYALAQYSYVAPAGNNAVLKLTPPEDDESDEEADALELWDGDGAVRLLRRDAGRRALLVERAGADISDLADEEATRIAVATGLKLWRPAAEPFRWIGDHVPGWLDRAGEPMLAPVARELYASLDVGRNTLVHGDFHHHNILRSTRGPVAIDPKPMLGEPEYDVPSFLWNPRWHRMRRDVTERRLAAFAAAGLDEERMRKWTVIRGAYLRPEEAEELLALI